MELHAALPTRTMLIPPQLRPGRDLLSEGTALAATWKLGSNLFLETAGVSCEADYKRAMTARGRIMRHAHIGFRDVGRTLDAIAEVHATCARHGAIVDRFGITLDWSMGYPTATRAARPKGTGIVLCGPEDFARIANAAPAAAHFGDFMLGLPGALENTQAALVAGVTSIGNLGQYFTFRLPDWDDDVATTEATVTALALIAAQPTEILVHSNLDDGFAGLFSDMSSALGMVLVEKYIVEDLIGARVSHCFGHHFTAPLLRMAFHKALTMISDTAGTMIFGNTVSYRATPAGNYASLASYLQADIWALTRQNSGHAINPVPVTENERIPDIGEIIDAQLFAARMTSHVAASLSLIDTTEVDAHASLLVGGARRFAARLLAGLGEIGIAMRDPAEVMLALRRIGPRRIEALFGAGIPDSQAWGGRRAVILAEWVEELEEEARTWVEGVRPEASARIREGHLRVCIGTSDVHEHGKALIERTLVGLDVAVIDGGTSVDPDDLVAAALAANADVIAVSTYNGIALRYAREVKDLLAKAGSTMPICIGGRLNQIPDDSNSSLPVDVSQDIRALGVTVCDTPAELFATLAALAPSRPDGSA